MNRDGKGHLQKSVPSVRAYRAIPSFLSGHGGGSPSSSRNPLPPERRFTTWFMLRTAGQGQDVRHGHKVSKLTVRMFPRSNHVVGELNTKIRRGASQPLTRRGCIPSNDTTRNRFASEGPVLRGVASCEVRADPLFVRQPLNYCVNVQERWGVPAAPSARLTRSAMKSSARTCRSWRQR